MFRNSAHEPVSVLMGHPDWLMDWEGSIDPARYRHGEPDPKRWALRDFAATVEGRRVDTTHVLVERPEPDPPLTAEAEEELRRNPPHRTMFDEAQGAYTWPVAIPAASAVVVTNRYDFSALHTMGGLDACRYLGLRSDAMIPASEVEAAAWWRRTGAPAYAAAWDDAVCSRATYLVTSATTWGGPIGRADIRLRMPAEFLPHQIAAIPAPTRMEGTWLVWTRSDWRPTSDIHVIFLSKGNSEEEWSTAGGRARLMPTVGVARAWIDHARACGADAETVRLERNAYYAAHGMRFADPALDRYFRGFDWYVPRDGAGALDLTPEERAIVRELRAFEDELHGAAAGP